MQISEIWVSQRKLRCAAQIPAMIETLKLGCLPRVILNRSKDGSVQVDDGHHRLSAYWLSGRRTLKRSEYLLVESERQRPRFGKVRDLLNRCGLDGG